MSRTIFVFVLALIVPTIAAAQEAALPPCPPVVEIPTEAVVAGLRACGEEELAVASERRMRILRGLAEEPVVAAPVAAPEPSQTPPPAFPPPAFTPDSQRAALLATVTRLEEELRVERERVVAAPPVAAAPVVAAAPEPVIVTETEQPRLPYIGEGTTMTGSAANVPLVTAFPGFLHRRPVPWSHMRGLRLWNGLYCDGDFSFAIEVRVDGRVVIPTEMGAALPPTQVVDSSGLHSTAYLIPQGRDRRSGGYVYIPVGGGDHDVEVTVYDAPFGMVPMRLGGGRFSFNPSSSGDLHSLIWYEVSGSDGGFCGAR